MPLFPATFRCKVRRCFTLSVLVVLLAGNEKETASLKPPLLISGQYWDRTSDLSDVNAALVPTELTAPVRVSIRTGPSYV